MASSFIRCIRKFVPKIPTKFKSFHSKIFFFSHYREEIHQSAHSIEQPSTVDEAFYSSAPSTNEDSDCDEEADDEAQEILYADQSSSENGDRSNHYEVSD
jgi:hypothetical protein